MLFLNINIFFNKPNNFIGKICDYFFFQGNFKQALNYNFCIQTETVVGGHANHSTMPKSMQLWDGFAQIQAPNQWVLQHALPSRGCTGTFWPQAREMLYHDPPNYCTSVSLLRPPSHRVTCRGAGMVFVPKRREAEATASRGLRCDTRTGLHCFVWMWTLKALLVKQRKKSYTPLPFQFQRLPTDLTSADRATEPS